MIVARPYYKAAFVVGAGLFLTGAPLPAAAHGGHDEAKPVVAGVGHLARKRLLKISNLWSSPARIA